MCLAPGCHNQVYARNLCTRHGGKRQCAVDGCHQHARVREFCSKHSTGHVKKRCVHDGCTKLANARQRCVRHGGGRQCRISGCGTHARSGGYCRRHSKASSSQCSTSAPGGDDDEQDQLVLGTLNFDVPIEDVDWNWMDNAASPVRTWIDGDKPEIDFDCTQEYLGSLEDLLV
ncbi:Aste57867_8128 [Aphanomyces stellatus]|uniref:Aste57867_8128 protein n=1 Tax=Aphanomyces stellatus TaxID=120398 RepID=A0A485KJE8_9STRA|nr:hypothetical protein As57867_008098 [Aphanomyces stellatus]VFT85017.1 Aste57867_8128 [Aphanomyces stellatus]